MNMPSALLIRLSSSKIKHKMKKASHFTIKNEIRITYHFRYNLFKILNNNYVHYLNVILYITIIFFLDNAI